MKLIHSPSNDPYFNLALEEYLFENFQENFILIYINSDSVVCGKHQNAVAESNSRFLFENEVPLIRRFSGGGTVYHDVGNINFSFITTGKDNKVIDFKRYAQPIVNFLRSLGIHAELSDRNDIMIEGFKVSGHAAHAKNKRALHHGTLLYNSDLEKLSLGLRSNPDKFESRAVKSVRSQVANISQYFDNNLDINEFVEMLGNSLIREFPMEGVFNIPDKDNGIIEKLIVDKYKTFDWNYGYGPDYKFHINIELGDEFTEMNISVSKGLIIEVEILKKTTFDQLLKQLEGTQHFWPLLSKKLTGLICENQSIKIIDQFF